MKAFTKSEFGYCPLSNKINHIHERALRITHRDKSSTFQEFLQNGNSVSIHHRNVQKFSIEIYNIFYGFSPLILNYIFVPVSRLYNFRRNDTLQKRRVNSLRHGTESIHLLDQRYGILYPVILHYHKLLRIFKKKRKK